MTSATKSIEKIVNQKLCNTVLILDALYDNHCIFGHEYTFAVQGLICPSYDSLCTTYVTRLIHYKLVFYYLFFITDSFITIILDP